MTIPWGFHPCQQIVGTGEQTLGLIRTQVLLDSGMKLIGPWGWSGGAMVLGNLPVPGRPTILITVGQGPTALAVGAGKVVWTFLFSFILSLLFHPLFGRRPNID